MTLRCVNRFGFCHLHPFLRHRLADDVAHIPFCPADDGDPAKYRHAAEVRIFERVTIELFELGDQFDGKLPRALVTAVAMRTRS